MHKFQSQQGFGVIELLTVLLMMSFIMAGTFQVFKSSLQMNEASDLKSDADQNFRAASSFLTRDMMQAGQGMPTGGIPIPTGTGILAIKRPGPAGSNLTFPSGSNTLPAVSPGAGLGPTLLGQITDIITIIYADNTLPLSSVPLQAISAQGDTMTVDASVPITGNYAMAAGDLVLFSNAQGNALQQVTATNGTQTVTMAATDSLNLNQRSAPQGTILQLKSGGVFPPTTATRVWMISYYLDETTNPITPRLVRKINDHPGRAVAMGIENLQITYDLVDGATNPTDVDTTTTPNQIRKANLLLAVRSNYASTQTREFFRNNVSTQISFRSLAFVDRYR